MSEVPLYNLLTKPETRNPKTGTRETGALIRTNSYDKCVASMKITAQLDHLSLCKAKPGTNWSNRWTNWSNRQCSFVKSGEAAHATSARFRF